MMSAGSTHGSDTDGKGNTLRFDVIAGLTAAAVVLPKAMAYATVAGLPVEVGLYTAFVPMASTGCSAPLACSASARRRPSPSSRAPSSGPWSRTATRPGCSTATATLTVLVGASAARPGVLRLGFVANFISAPVLTGFKAGIGLVILLDQAPKLFGLHIHEASFFADLLSLLRHFPETSLPTLDCRGCQRGAS